MSSGFVSSEQLSEERKKRQEDWERVRKPEDPQEAPEVEVCNKSLFEQLRTNKEKKDLEMQEAKAFKNMIRGIDEDESQFLSMVNDIQRKDEMAKKEEERELLRQMRSGQAQSSVSSVPSILPSSSLKPTPPANSVPMRSKQASLISSLIKRKSTNDDSREDGKKAKSGEEGANEKSVEGSSSCSHVSSAIKVVAHCPSIPGIGDYGSDDDSSSDEDTVVPCITTVIQSIRKDKKQEDEDDD